MLTGRIGKMSQGWAKVKMKSTRLAANHLLLACWGGFKDQHWLGFLANHTQSLSRTGIRGKFMDREVI